jgi:hypothetical protein
VTRAPSPTRAPTLARAIRFWAAVDLVVTSALAVPPLGRARVAALDQIERALGGAGVPDVLPNLAWIFVHETGTLGVLCALLPLARPGPALGSADAIGRAWVGFLILRFVFAGGVPRGLLLFVVTEWGGAAAQIVALVRHQRASVPHR